MKATRPKPNIVYILADDMGYGDVSCLNAESKIRTRHLDRLAGDGAIFCDAHSTSAVCTPSRYSILTGRYNWRSRLKKGVVFGYSPPVLETGRLTVAELLRREGYATACIGKWHLGWDWAGLKNEDPETVDYSRPIQNGPLAHGFERFFGISASLDMPPYVWIENDCATAQPDRVVPESKGKAFWREGPIAPDFQHEQVLPRLAREANGFIEENARNGKPFFLYFPLPAPHTPILPLPQYEGKSGAQAYGDFCLQVDDLVGGLMETLEKCGVTDETWVIFTADNGCSPAAGVDELEAIGHRPSYVFRGYKADIYEGGHRVPLLMRWPEVIPAGTVHRETVCLVDLMATCADFLGVELSPDAGEDSVSHLSLLRGDPLDGSLREATVHHSIDGSFSIRAGKWKLEMCPGSGGWSYPRPGPECQGLPAIQLYNLDSDIGERTNLYAAHPEVVERLRTLLDQYIVNGRSTPGPAQPNTGDPYWDQLWWMKG